MSKKNFGRKIAVSDIVLLFVISSFIGYIIEEIWFFMHRGYFESRATVLYGPFSLVYGFCVIAVTLVLSRFEKKTPLKIFIVSFIFASLSELVFSMMQELIFGSFGWDYSHAKLNFDGRICLLYSVYWGLLGIVFIKIFFPLFDKLSSKIKTRTKNSLAFVLAVLMILNIFISCAAGMRKVKRSENIVATNSFDSFLDNRFPDDYLKKVLTTLRY